MTDLEQRLAHFCVAFQLDHAPEYAAALAEAQRNEELSPAELVRWLLGLVNARCHAVQRGERSAGRDDQNCRAFTRSDRRSQNPQESRLSGHFACIIRALAPDTKDVQASAAAWAHYVRTGVSHAVVDPWRRYAPRSPLCEKLGLHRTAEHWIIVLESGPRLLISVPAGASGRTSAIIEDIGSHPNPTPCTFRRIGHQIAISVAGWRNYRLKRSPDFGSGICDVHVSHRFDAALAFDEQQWTKCWGPASNEQLAEQPPVTEDGKVGVAYRLEPTALPEGRTPQAYVGTWLKLSEGGGSYLVDLEDGGKLRERHALHPGHAGSRGWWFVDEQASLCIALGNWALWLSRDDLPAEPCLHVPESAHDALRLATEREFEGRARITHFLVGRVARD